MANKPASWKTIRDQKREENFVGRGEPIRLFTENLSAETPEFMVVSLTGEGGVGKSTLLSRFAYIASSTLFNSIVITCDDKQLSPVSVMGFIAEKLREKDITHKEFDERYKKCRELRQELESDPNMPRSAVSVLTHGITDFTIKSLRRAPGVGVIFDYADEKAAGDAFAELVQYSITKWGNKDEVKLLREPEHILTPLFLALIRKAYEEQKVLLMFDVFEQTCDTLSPWLLNLFEFEYGEYDVRLSFVISGREPLDQRWTELAGLICHISLEPFSLDETRMYLNNQGITDEILVAQIFEDTGGLPVLMELLAATKPQPGMPLPDISKDAVERFLQWTPGEEQRRAALLAAIPRQFNQDILSTVFDRDTTKLFDWLSSQSYVRRDNERGWFYHDKVRDLMIRYLKYTVPSELYTAHQKLVDFFRQENEKLSLDESEAYRDDAWKKTEIERLYHFVMSRPDHREIDLINAFLHAFRWNWQFSNSIVHLAHQIEHEIVSKSIEKSALSMAEFYEAYQQEDYEKVVILSTFFDNYSNSTLKARSALLARRGQANNFLDKYDLALQDLTDAIELDSKYAWAFYQRGDTYRLMDRYEEALQDFNKAIELDPKDAWPFGSRGYTYRSLGKYQEALKDFNKAIELDPKTSWFVAHRGVTYRFMEKYDEALKDFNKAIELDPKSAWRFANRGVTYLSMKKYKEALEDLNHAIELDSKDPWIFAQRGLTYRLMEKHEEALQDINQAIELGSRDVLAFFSRGQTHRSMKKYEDALQDYSRAIELDPNAGWVFANRGYTYRLLGKYKQALQDFDRAIELGSRDAWTFAQRGDTYRWMEKHEEALEDINQAIELDPKTYWFFAHRGLTHRSMKKYEDALQDFTQAIELDPKAAWSSAERGMIFLFMGKYIEALQDFNRAIEFDNNSSSRFYQRSLAYLILNDKPSANQDLERALKISGEKFEREPRNWENIFRLALCYLAFSDFEQSEKLYRNALKEEIYPPLLKDAKNDLDEFLLLFPDNVYAKAMRGLFA